MKDEIKEILDKLKDSVDNPIIDVPTMDGTDSEPMGNTVLLEPNESKILLDYITNLQEENKELNDDNIWWNNRFKAVQRNYKDYKSRNKKAIEFIEENLTFYITIGGTDERKLIGYNKAFDELLKILKGSEKE